MSNTPERPRALPWFRLYSEILTDPKVQMLSEQDQRRYIMLLCMRCSNTDVTLHDALLKRMDNKAVCFMLRISPEEWAETRANLLEAELITADNLPTAWDKRQYKSDSSAERVKRHRLKKKQAKKAAQAAIKPDQKTDNPAAVTGCNVTVTPPETETETETDKNPPSVRPSEYIPRVTPVTPIALPDVTPRQNLPVLEIGQSAHPPTGGTQLTDHWQPSDSDLRKTSGMLLAAGMRWDPGRQLVELETFRAHHQQTENGRANWSAAWRKWVGKAIQIDRENTTRAAQLRTVNSAGGAQTHGNNQPGKLSLSERVWLENCGHTGRA